jgi:hypothetical protein
MLARREYRLPRRFLSRVFLDYFLALRPRFSLFAPCFRLSFRPEANFHSLISTSTCGVVLNPRHSLWRVSRSTLGRLMPFSFLC